MMVGPLDDHTYFARYAFTHLGFWWKMYDCSLHHFATSYCNLKYALLRFPWKSKRLAEIWMGGLFDPRFGDYRERRGSRINLFDSSPADSYKRPIATYGLSLVVLVLVSWLQSVFDLDTMTNVALEANASSSGKTHFRFCTFKEQQYQCKIILWCGVASRNLFGYAISWADCEADWAN